MTRETRIGLLVGLVFIVMFGLVLAEFTGKSGIQPTQTLAENNNKPLYQRQALPKFDDFQPPPAVAPAPSPSPSASAPQLTTTDSARASAPAADTGPKPVVLVSLAAPTPDPVEPAPTRASAAVAAESSEPGPVAAAPPSTPATSGRVYVVEDKDTFIKIARRFYGADHESEYKKIMDANKLKDAAGLKKGMKLVIPGVAGVPAPASGTPAGTAAVATAIEPAAAIRVDLRDSSAPAVAVTPATAPAASSGRTYVVQNGDTVAKIARKFLSSDSKANVDKILKANKLETPEKLRAGATLEIPS